MRGPKWVSAIGMVALLTTAALSGTGAVMAQSESPGASPAASEAPVPTLPPGTPVASPKVPTIGFVVPLISNPYWKLIQDFAEGAAGTLGINLIPQQADSDEAKQISIIEGLIAQPVDGLVVGPVSDKVGATILADAETANIPVVFMQRPPGVDYATYTGKQFIGFVGTDDSGGGTTASQILYDAGARKWVAMGGDQGNGVSEARLAAANDFAAAHPDMQIIQTQMGNEARDAGQTTMENFLSALPGPGFDGVYSFNDEGALGAIQALKSANVTTDQVKVVGIDGTTDAVAAVLSGDMLASVGGGYACGAFALTELYDYLNGFPVTQPVYNLPLLPVTKDNAQAYTDQVLNGMGTYDFKSVSAVYTPGATQKDYAIVLH
jgi:ribose transport system substrate-binding protein